MTNSSAIWTSKLLPALISDTDSGRQALARLFVEPCVWVWEGCLLSSPLFTSPPVSSSKSCNSDLINHDCILRGSLNAMGVDMTDTLSRDLVAETIDHTPISLHLLRNVTNSWKRKRISMCHLSFGQLLQCTHVHQRFSRRVGYDPFPERGCSMSFHSAYIKADEPL